MDLPQNWRHEHSTGEGGSGVARSAPSPKHAGSDGQLVETGYESSIWKLDMKVSGRQVNLKAQWPEGCPLPLLITSVGQGARHHVISATPAETCQCPDECGCHIGKPFQVGWFYPANLSCSSSLPPLGSALGRVSQHPASYLYGLAGVARGCCCWACGGSWLTLPKWLPYLQAGQSLWVSQTDWEAPISPLRERADPAPLWQGSHEQQSAWTSPHTEPGPRLTGPGPRHIEPEHTQDLDTQGI